MNKKNELIVTLDGVTYHTVRPKVKDWYNFAKFEDQVDGLSVAEYLQGAAGCIASVFDGLTPEKLLENMELDDFKPLYLKCWRWLIQFSNEKMGESPNGQTETGK